MADLVLPAAFTDLEIRILQKQDQGYPVEITLGGQQEFPRGYLPLEVLPWTPSGDLVSDGQKLFETLFKDSTLRSAWAEARGQTHVLVSPYPDLPKPVVASAWGLQLPLDDVNDARLSLFVSRYEKGPQTPEPGALCTGGIGTPLS